MKKEASENEVRYRAEAYCSVAERCPADVERKLVQWGAAPEAVQNVMRHLLAEKYIDLKRFSVAFVRDKYRFDRWGRNKIRRALQQKGIPEQLVAAGLEEIDEREYREMLSDLLRRKEQTLTSGSAYERYGKLMRFATARGFEPEMVSRCIKQSDIEDASVD